MKAELEVLTTVYLDGTITPPQLQQLNALLLADAEARRECAELLNVDSALAALAAEWTPPKGAAKPLKPVSYTHLDVYKRQLQGRPQEWAKFPMPPAGRRRQTRPARGRPCRARARAPPTR